MVESVVNNFGLQIKIGDKLLITSDRIGNKMLANVDKGEIIIVSSFSDDSKIIYHHNTLALPVNADIYTKIVI